jgi:hypothetical protein
MLMVLFAIFCLIWLLPNQVILWRLLSTNLFFVSGGQFQPVGGGQFPPVRDGHFKPVWGGQFDRILQYTDRNREVAITQGAQYAERSAERLRPKHRI